MTPKEFLTAAIDGGYDPLGLKREINQKRQRMIHPATPEEITDFYWENSKQAFEVLLLNPDVWRCVAVSKGWMYYHFHMIGMIDYMIRFDKDWRDYLETL